MDQSCEKLRSITKSQGRQKYPANSKRRKANWIGHILHRNCLLKHVIDGEMEGIDKRQEDEKEDVSSCWMTLRKRGWSEETRDRNTRKKT